MKRILIAAAFFALCFMNAQNASAQVRVNVNINVGDQPKWRVAGYDYVEYYYLPDIETYYYVPSRQFIYLSNGNWIFSASLPARYRTYDLYSGHKVVINRTNAYHYHSSYKVKYPGKYNNPGKHKGWYKGKGKKGRKH